MGLVTKGFTPTTNAIPSAAQWNAIVDPIYTEIAGKLDEANVDYTNADGIVTMAQTQTISGLKTFNANIVVGNGAGLNIGDGTQQVISTGDGSTNLTPEFQILGTAMADATQLIGAWSTTATRAAAPTFALLKSGNATIGSHTIVTDDEILGSIIAYADDGTDYESSAAAIEFAVDGTPGTGDMPGRIVFYTTINGGEVLTEALRLDAVQKATFAGAVQVAGISTFGGNILSDTDSTDDIGTTGVRWKELFVDDIVVTTTVTVGTMTVAGGSLTDSSGAISFGNESLSTTGTLASGVLTVTGAILPNANDGGALGVSGTAWSDLFLANGSVLNFHAGDVTLTHSANTLTVAGGTLATAALTATSLSVGDGNITNVGQIAVDTIVSDGSTVTIGTGSTLVFTDNTTIAMTLGTDAGDDFTVNSTHFVVEGDTGFVGIGAVPTASALHITHDGQCYLRFTETSDGEVGYVGAANHMITGGTADYLGVRGESGIQFTGGGSAVHATLDTNGSFMIGTGTNAKQTVGLTVDMGTNINEIFTLQSTGSVAHGFTGTTANTTFFKIGKVSATYGGAQLTAVSENGQNLVACEFRVFGGSTGATAGTGEYGTFDVKCAEHDGSDGIVDYETGDITHTFSRRIGGAWAVAMAIDAEGDLHVDGSATVGTFDNYQDAHLVRALDLQTTKDTIDSKWDEFVNYDRQSLVEAKIISDPDNGNPMTNITRLQRLHNGTLWQLYTRIMDLCETLENNVPALRGKLLPEVS